MLRAADEPNPQVERSIRARLDQHAAPYNISRAISDLLQFELVITTLTQAAMESVTATSFAGVGADKKAEESKEKYLAFLTGFMGMLAVLRGSCWRLLRGRSRGLISVYFLREDGIGYER